MATPTIIHFVRHGDVENPKNIRYGRLPGFHLSEVGRKQIEQASLFFVNRPITHIYSSPLERAQQTATLVGLVFPQVSITIDDRLLETKVVHSQEGTPIQSGYDYPKQDSRDAESSPTVTGRVGRFVEDKLIAHQGQEIVAASHADVIAFFYAKEAYLSSSIKDPYPVYASVFSFVYTGLTLKQVWYRGIDE